MARHNKLTEGQSKAIKTLLRGGASQKEAAEYMQLSTPTVCRVAKAETLEEYQQMVTESHSAKEVKGTAAQATPAQPAAPQVNNPTVVRIEATHYMMQEMQKTNELLTLISRKLAFIVDELCGVGKKDG